MLDDFFDKLIDLVGGTPDLPEDIDISDTVDETNSITDIGDAVGETIQSIGDSLDSIGDSSSVNDMLNGGISATSVSDSELASLQSMEAMTDDHLGVSDSDVSSLQNRANGIERTKNRHNQPFLGKMCPTRHGCTGATNCNYDYASYPG